MDAVLNDTQGIKDPVAKCQYWLEMMKRLREPRHSTCLRQYLAIMDSKQSQVKKRIAMEDLYMAWDRSNLLSDLMAYAKSMSFMSAFSATSFGKSLLTNQSLFQYGSNWTGDLVLTNEELHRFEEVARQTVLSQAPFVTGGTTNYESNLVPSGPMTNLEVAQMASFTKAVGLNMNILACWKSHSDYGHATIEENNSSPANNRDLQTWSLVFEKIPAFLWKASADIGKIIKDADFDLFPTETGSAPQKFQSLAFCIIMGCVSAQVGVQKHPLWQLVAINALKSDRHDLIGLLICLAGLDLLNPKGSPSRQAFLQKSECMKRAAAWIIYQAIFVLPLENDSVVAPKTLALLLSSGMHGWTSPTSIRVIYPSFQPTKMVLDEASTQARLNCCWCNMAALPTYYYSVSESDTLPDLLHSLVSQVVEYGTSVLHECSPVATIPTSILARVFDSHAKSFASSSVSPIGNLALHFPQWISVCEKQNHYIFVPAQQLLHLGESTIGKYAIHYKTIGSTTEHTSPAKEVAVEIPSFPKFAPPKQGRRKDVKNVAPSLVVTTTRPKRGASLSARKTISSIAKPSRYR